MQKASAKLMLVKTTQCDKIALAKLSAGSDGDKMARGVQQANTATVTTALRGVLATGEPRAEFLAVANGG